MSKKNVITIKNEELNISKTRKFSTGYYKVGDINIENSGDCYKIDNKFYRFETGQVVFNNSIKEYQLINNNIIYGLIEDDKLGYFNKDERNKIPVIFKTGIKSFAINEEVLKNNLNYREQLSTGNFVHISLISSNNFNEIIKPDENYKKSLPYDSKGITDTYSYIYNSLYNSDLNIYSKKLGEFLEELTFGLEFETTKGFIPERITKKLGLIPLRDGSISGLEYVTVPLKEGKGVQTVVDICKELKKRTSFDNSCALHLHIGNIPRTPEFILAFLKISSNFQNNIFELFPLYKKYNMGIKNKNYSKPYDLFNIFNSLDPIIDSNNINKNFSVLIKNLTSNKKSFLDYNNNIDEIKSHPADPQDNQKWNISTRYFFYNFIPLIFGNKQTIEFRIHTPTFDYYRVLMFLLFNSILIKFTKKYQLEILKDPNFLKKLNVYENYSSDSLCNFLNFYKNEETYSKEIRMMIDCLINYFRSRKRQTETLTLQGKIQYQDSEIFYTEKINFDNLRKPFLEKENTKLEKLLETITNITPSNINSKKEISKPKFNVNEKINPQISETILKSIKDYKNYYNISENEIINTFSNSLTDF